MTEALGAPEKMAERREELTPMLSQYLDLCERYDDALVLFQVGDFYETFCEAAEEAARVLEITLTAREDSTGTYPMAGIPIDNAEPYIETLLESGYRVAVADQVEDADATNSLVDRAVTRIVTPGTVTEDELLGGDENNFVAALTGGETYGLAFLDVSTGDFVATSADSRQQVRDEVGRFAPAEAVVEPGVDTDLFAADCMVTRFREDAFDSARAREKLDAYFGAPERRLAGDSEIRACGALLAYAEYTRAGQQDELDYLNHLTRYDPRDYMVLDAVALRSLELFEPRSVHGREGTTLVDVLDETSCALGRRKLTDWLRRPLVDRDRIDARLDGVEELRGDLRTREELAEALRDVYDIERLISRVSRGRANARDLRSLQTTLDVIPTLRELLADADSGKLRDLRARLQDLSDVREEIGDAIVDDPPQELTEGGVVRDGYDETLDDLRETEREGKQWIRDLEESEKARTGVESLKVGHNSVHGYYIEVTKANTEHVPESYERRQTLKNSERYVTPELKEREDEIVRAEGRADDREYELFVAVRESVAAEAERVQDVAAAVAELDALCSLATVAAEYDYSRPEMREAGAPIDIEGGRHPVVERTEDGFVPNGVHLGDDERIAVITGPNMSGKSTYMRQVALVCVLAQVGSFVPAESAELGVLNRVFTRVGASDDIAGGRSTFMVEMTELADILRDADDDSLVLLDEVGRGTSTADGLAIARAITEYIHDETGAKTLFATHHHELTDLATNLDEAVNLHFPATQEGDEVAFRHDVAYGAATASYGIEVAKAAGVPDDVVNRARELVERERERDAVADSTSERAAKEADGGSAPSDIEDALRDVDLAQTTPLEAMTVLQELKRRL
ncbi:DNA mismatch repair protein MutS [Salarchaeum japonicum]|uniref:DNA mismatch repair protein MutS n=1 Tax=Salarchaeum japonicum TaxID=555573 RepID=UPI003C759279